jgi:hypothetical protein
MSIAIPAQAVIQSKEHWTPVVTGVTNMDVVIPVVTGVTNRDYGHSRESGNPETIFWQLQK